MGSFLEEKASFKMLGLTFFSKSHFGSYITFVAKTDINKIGALFYERSFSRGCSASP